VKHEEKHEKSIRMRRIGSWPSRPRLFVIYVATDDGKDGELTNKSGRHSPGPRLAELKGDI
jgi:hypothetical protein